MKNFQSYMHGYIMSQIKYWEERRPKEKDPVLVALCIGRIQAYYDILKEMEETQNIAEYGQATEATIESNRKKRLEALEKEENENE